ncbi:MAG: hypothetical protein PHV43_01150 [Candidatus Colwellbacteria bacterium]|nr:hypothetical protein [Candidatus Colwellbacteria bacterium]
MNYIGKYADFLETFLKAKAPVKIVLDVSNGPAGLVLEKLFKDRAGIEAIILNKEVSGEFPAHGPNPLVAGAADEVSRKVLEEDADLGAIYDGDGDRVIFISNKGKAIDPFDAFFLIRNRFQPPYIVDVRALSEFISPDPEIIEAAAGRSYIYKALKKENAQLGVERSGHFFFRDFFYQDSAVLATVHMINAVSALKKNGQSIDEVLAGLGSLERLPEMSFEVNDGEGVLRRLEAHYQGIPGFKIERTDGITIIGPDLALNVRVSNTEPVVRLNIVAKNRKMLDEKLIEIKKVMGV